MITRTDTTPAAPRRSTRRWMAVALVVTGMVAYANGFTGRFAGLDAKESIRDNPHIRKLRPLAEAMSLPLLDSTKAADEGSKGGTVVRRPILSLSFALNHALTGMRANGFHAVNIAIHLAAALLLFGVVRRSLLLPAAGGRDPTSAAWLAFATAALWLLHPVQTESVTYIVQRAESLMGLFFLLTVYASVRAFESAQPARWYLLAIVACALGMGTKEVAAVAPVIVLLYDATFVRRGPKDALRERPLFYAGLFSTWLILALLMALTAEDVSSDFNEGRNLSYALAQPAVIVHYLRVALWPHPLYVYVNTTLYDDPTLWQTLVPMLFIVALVAFTAWGLVRHRWFGLVGSWFFLILAPSSSIVAVSDVIQDHRMYLSLAAVVFVVVVAVDATLRRLPGARTRPLVGGVLLAAAAVALAGATHARNRDFHGEFSMIHPADVHEAFLILGNHYVLGEGKLEQAKVEAREALETAENGSADFTFAHYVLGAAAEQAGDDARAIAHYERAVESDPTFALAQSKLARVLVARGETTRAREVLDRVLTTSPSAVQPRITLGRLLLSDGQVDAARTQFELALAAEPDNPVVINNLGYAAEAAGDLEAAVGHYRAALALDPLLVIARNNLGRALHAQGKLAEARAELESVIAVEPREVFAHHELAAVLESLGDSHGALEHLRAAVAIDDDAQSHSRLGAALERYGRTGEARSAYEQALARDPEHAGARNALATLLAREGRLEEAVPHFERVLRGDPGNTDAHANLGATLAVTGNAQRAAEHLQRALELDPQRAMVHFNLGLLAESQGDLGEAKRHFDRELRVNPGFAPARAKLESITSGQP